MVSEIIKDIIKAPLIILGNISFALAALCFKLEHQVWWWFPIVLIPLSFAFWYWWIRKEKRSSYL